MPRLSKPAIPRLKDFPQTPRLPAALGIPPAGADENILFETRFQELRTTYAAITRPEARVFLWLLKHFGADSQGIDWLYVPRIPSFGLRPTGIQVDFMILGGGRGRTLVWQVQGEFFHFGDPKTEATDLIEREFLEANGYEVVNLLESQINQDVDRVARAALNGEQLYQDPILAQGLGFPGDPSVNTRAS